MHKLPTLPYPGGKGRLATKLISYLPPEGRLYVEPCAGHGNIFWAASNLSYTNWWLNDIHTAPLFRAIRDIGDQVAVPERTRTQYLHYRQRTDRHSVVLEPYLSRNGAGYRKGGFCSGNGPTQRGYETTLKTCCALLRRRNTKVTALNWQEMGLESLTSEDTVVFDPPYYECDVRSYTNEFDHLSMVRLLTSAKFKWMLTEYSQPFYMEHLGEPVFRKEVQLLGTNSDKSKGENRMECVWTNL